MLPHTRGSRGHRNTGSTSGGLRNIGKGRCMELVCCSWDGMFLFPSQNEHSEKRRIQWEVSSHFSDMGQSHKRQRSCLFFPFGQLSSTQVSYHSHAPLQEVSLCVAVGNYPKSRAELDISPSSHCASGLKNI